MARHESSVAAASVRGGRRGARDAGTPCPAGFEHQVNPHRSGTKRAHTVCARHSATEKEGEGASTASRDTKGICYCRASNPGCCLDIFESHGALEQP